MSFRFQIIRDFTLGLLKLGFYTHMQSFHVSIHSCIPQIFTECCFGASFQSPGVLAPQVGRGGMQIVLRREKSEVFMAPVSWGRFGSGLRSPTRLAKLLEKGQ